MLEFSRFFVGTWYLCDQFNAISVEISSLADIGEIIWAEWIKSCRLRIVVKSFSRLSETDSSSLLLIL
jgi:hypothetical protein